MQNETQRPQERICEPELSYFGLQAYMGTTKHMGGLETTNELLELCHIDEASIVLDVGCGVGATACYLAKEHGCQVVGVDIHEGMIARANQRARREGVEERVEFRLADARDLPFEDAQFDVVLSESVATFIEDKQKVLSECARVTRPGGYVGLNEEAWIKTPPPEMVEYAEHTWDVKPDIPTYDRWLELLEDAGLRDMVAKNYKVEARREATQLRRYSVGDMLRMFYRILVLYIKSPAFRQYMKERRRLPKGAFEYLGYGLFVGRK